MNDDDNAFSLFVNPTRKEIFEYICTNPGSYLMNIGQSMNLDRVVVTRHLLKLHEEGLVGKHEFKGKTIFYPRGLRSDDIEKAFSQLKNQTRREIFLFVLNSPGCHQLAIANNFASISKRQVVRMINAMIDAGLLSSKKSGSRIVYDLGKVGQKIVTGSFETIDPFLNMLREKSGHEVTAIIDGSVVSISLSNGETMRFSLGGWTMTEIDTDTIAKNKYILLGEGGEMVLSAIYGGCKDYEAVHHFTAISLPVVRAKTETLRVLGLVTDFEKSGTKLEITKNGIEVVEKILAIKK